MRTNQIRATVAMGLAAALVAAVAACASPTTPPSDSGDTPVATEPPSPTTPAPAPIRPSGSGEPDDAVPVSFPGEVMVAPAADAVAITPDADQIAAIARLSEALFAQVRSMAPDPNTVLSPLSVFFALGLAGQAAGGGTAEAFAQVLGLDAAQTNGIALDLLTSLEGAGGDTKLALANSVWADDALTLNEDYAAVVKAYYQASLFDVDLQTQPAVDEVNAWVSQKTGGLIPSLVDQFPPEAVAVLINALYLKAVWATHFDYSMTTPRDFTRADGAIVQAPFMSLEIDTATAFESPEATGVLLPYNDGRLAFLAVKPAAGNLDGLTWDGTAVGGWLKAAQATGPVTIAMPKFEATGSWSLTEALKGLGLEVAFDPRRADLSGLGTASDNLYIGDVVHKVVVKVDEDGTEAAAVTGIEVGVAALPVNMTYITFDSPYLYAVVDTVTGLPLFLGAMDDPSLAMPTN